MHPGAARAVSFWMPERDRGIANGLVTAAAVVGVALTYYVFGLLMDLVGWPSAFLVSGVATLLLALVWAIYAADHPREHPGVNEAERRLVEVHGPAQAVSDTPADPDPQPGFAALLRNGSLVVLTVSYAMYSYFQYLFFYWMQYYFEEVMKLGTHESRLYAMLPNLAMAVGMTAGGWLADRARSRFGRRRGRAVVPFCGMAASAVLLVLGILRPEPVWVVTCFTLALGALGTSEAPFWVTGIELGRQRGGLSASILNAGGNVGGILAPVITPLFSSYFGWRAGLCLASALCLFGAVLWWWVDQDDHRDSPTPRRTGAPVTVP
jgi:sugar phosphate permease